MLPETVNRDLSNNIPRFAALAALLIACIMTELWFRSTLDLPVNDLEVSQKTNKKRIV